MTRAEGERESCIKLGAIEGVVDASKLALGFWLIGSTHWCGECECGKTDVEKCLKAWNGIDGGGVEGCPWADLSDVPPKVLALGIADMNVELTNQCWSWVLSSKVCH